MAKEFGIYKGVVEIMKITETVVFIMLIPVVWFVIYFAFAFISMDIGWATNMTLINGASGFFRMLYLFICSTFTLFLVLEAYNG